MNAAVLSIAAWFQAVSGIVLLLKVFGFAKFYKVYAQRTTYTIKQNGKTENENSDKISGVVVIQNFTVK